MRNRQKTPLAKNVVIDSHRGMVYFDDVACRIRKYHDKGFRNIYSVVMVYALREKEKDHSKTIRMDYGNFHQAFGRFMIETSSNCFPSRMKLKNIQLLVSTFNGRKLMNEDTLRQVEYGKRNIKLNGVSFSEGIGEETY